MSKTQELARAIELIDNDCTKAAALLRQQDEALKMALESMCWAARVLNINEDEAPEFFKSITKLKDLT